MEKTNLIEQMKIVTATAFAFYLKAHNYHWNVTGPNFSELHRFFGDVYQQAHDSVDQYGEHVRSLGSFAPASFARFTELSKIEDETMVPKAQMMIAKLSFANKQLIAELRVARTLAIAVPEPGVTAFIENKIDEHDKLQWQLDAFVEK